MFSRCLFKLWREYFCENNFPLFLLAQFKKLVKTWRCPPLYDIFLQQISILEWLRIFRWFPHKSQPCPKCHHDFKNKTEVTHNSGILRWRSTEDQLSFPSTRLGFSHLEDQWTTYFQRPASKVSALQNKEQLSLSVKFLPSVYFLSTPLK